MIGVKKIEITGTPVLRTDVSSLMQNHIDNQFMIACFLFGVTEQLTFSG